MRKNYLLNLILQYAVKGKNGKKIRMISDLKKTEGKNGVFRGKGKDPGKKFPAKKGKNRDSKFGVEDP